MDDNVKKALKEFLKVILSAGVAFLTTLITNCQM